MNKMIRSLIIAVLIFAFVGSLIGLMILGSEDLTAREGIETLSSPLPTSGVSRVISEDPQIEDPLIEEDPQIESSTESLAIADEIESEADPSQVPVNETDPAPDETIVDNYVSAIEPIENLYLNVPMSAEEQDFARNISEQYGIPFELTMAVIYAESRYNPNAISDTKDYGLMQISYVNLGWLASDLNITDIMDPYQNIKAGVHILSEKIRNSGGDLTTALIRYNVGDKDALKLFEQGIFSTYYSEEVLGKYYEYLRGGY